MSDPRKEIEKAIASITAMVERAAGDPARAAQIAHQAVEAWNQALPTLARLRRSYVRAAQQAGVSMADLAKLFGVARQRLYQIADGGTHRGPRPGERKRTPTDEGQEQP